MIVIKNIYKTIYTYSVNGLRNDRCSILGNAKCSHTGNGNLDVNHSMGDTVLGTTVREKDLGDTIGAHMKVS